MLDPERLREAFKRKRYGAGEYDPDFDLFDAAADEIERLRAALKTARSGLVSIRDAARDENMFGLSSLVQIHINGIDTVSQQTTKGPE